MVINPKHAVEKPLNFLKPVRCDLCLSMSDGLLQSAVFLPKGIILRSPNSEYREKGILCVF